MLSYIDVIPRGPPLGEKLRTTPGQTVTHHRLILGDARDMLEVDGDSVGLVVTSPPYWTLKKYPDNTDQLGEIEDYELFQKELARVWEECYRVLLPGGRLCVNVGDVTLSRRAHGRHRVVPLHADILVRAREIGFDPLNPIYWWKRTNMKTEMSRTGSYFLGSRVPACHLQPRLLHGHGHSPPPPLRGTAVRVGCAAG